MHDTTGTSTAAPWQPAASWRADTCTSPKRKRGSISCWTSIPSLALRANVFAPEAARGTAPKSLCLALALLLSAGCLGSRGNVELLEAKLRQQQDLADRFQRQLAQTQSELTLAQQDADSLRKQMVDRGEHPLPQEYTQNLFQVAGLQFKPLLTGGRDRDGQPGDDVLIALIAPYDEHGDVVKLPGSLEVEALDMTRPEEERQVAHRVFSPQETKALWKSGFLASGFQCEVPWQQSPASDELLLHARLSTADGRQFDATHTIHVQPAEGAESPRRLATPLEARPVGMRTSARSRDSRAAAVPDGGTAIQPVGLESMLESVHEREVRPLPEDAAEENSDLLPPLVEESPGPGEAGAAAPAGAPRPFPAALETSDVWTDETIPRLR